MTTDKTPMAHILESDMQANPQRAKELFSNISKVHKAIRACKFSNRPVSFGPFPSPLPLESQLKLNDTSLKCRQIRLVAVSKLKPATDILALHQPTPSSSSPPAPHLHFGENYYQELLHKSTILPRSIRWHFIGALQTNKCRHLAEQVPNLWCVESVDSVKKADQLEKGRKALVERIARGEVTPQGQPGEEHVNGGVGEGAEEEDGNRDGEGLDEPMKKLTVQDQDGHLKTIDKLRVFVQVNTSGEASKSGSEPGDRTLELCTHIWHHCPHLRLQGLMTIGAIARSQAAAGPGQENEDFVRLTEVRDEVLAELRKGHVVRESDGRREGSEGEEKLHLELSMGMSGDFESAIRCGSDEVRVGSGIFGEREPKGGKKDKADKEDKLDKEGEKD